MAGSRTYISYVEMLKRCYNPTVIRYPQYGGRGIGVCDRWRHSFIAFLSDMGERPKNKSLDRIDVNADYSPENCRWASRSQQSRNTSRSFIISDRFGNAKNIQDWVEETGVPRTTLARYVRVYGLTLEQAVLRYKGKK